MKLDEISETPPETLALTEWLIGGGDMGTAVRALDWSNTSLGPRELWPQSLRSAVSTCLHNRFPVFLWWGPDLINIYNDAYVPILGKRHPCAFASPARELWKDVWPSIASEIEAVLSRGEASWQDQVLLVTDRNGFEENAYFTYSHSPVFDESGNVSGLMCVVVEQTSQVSAERRQRFLVEFGDVLREITDPAAIVATAVELLGKHLRASCVGYGQVQPDDEMIVLEASYVDGVEPLRGTFSLDSFGPENIARQRKGMTVVHDDVAADSSNNPELWASIQTRSFVSVPLIRDGRLRATLYVNDRKTRRWLPQEVALIKDVASRLWESIERSRITSLLAEREQRYRFLAETIPQMVWTATPDGALDYVNEQVASYFGSPAANVLGARWLEWVHPEDRQQAVERWSHSLKSGEPYEAHFRLLRQLDGAWRWHLVRARALCAIGGSITQWFGTCTDIEHEKQVEAELRQQWHTFDTALSHTPDFTYTFDLQGRFTYVNRALLSLWQKSFTEAVGRNFHELGYPPDLAERLQHQIQQVIETKEPVRDRTPFTSPTGLTRHYEYIFVPVLGNNGGVEAVAGSTRDITEQAVAEETIQEDRRRWQDLFAQTPAAIAVLHGPSHTFTWVNPEFERMTGRSAQALVGNTAIEAVPEVASQVYIDLLDNVYRTGEPFQGTESAIALGPDPDNLKQFRVNFVYLPTRDLQGHINGIFVHVTDVTDAVRAREEVEERERQFRTLAESIPNLTWMAQPDGDIFWYNQRWYDYTGTTFEAVKGWGWQTLHDPELLPAVMERWQLSLATGEPFEMVFPLKGADGQFRSFLTRGEPVRDSQGRIARWFGTNTDITEQQRSAEELRRINREMEEFAYVASHDLQEPLRMVNIYADLLVRRFAAADETAQGYARYVREGVSRMQTLIRDLLSYSRSVQRDEVPVGTASLSAALSEALSVLKPAVEECAAVINVGELPDVHGDTTQLAHVFQNLLSNSLKYRNQGVSPTINISAQKDGTRWIIAVQDNGIGFEQQYAQRIFGLFKRLHQQEFAGTGLGLAICQRIIERFHGQIWAEGTPGEGATFYFSLLQSEVQ